MSREGPQPAAESPSGLNPRQVRMVIMGLMLGMFLSSLDQTIVSTSMRTIADDLNGLEIQAWVSTAYLVAQAVTTPLYGKLSDIYGRKPFYLFAISLFVVGSTLCAYSQSMYELAAFRALQGLGAGGLTTLGLTIIADLVPARSRPKIQGLFLGVYGMSSVFGPLLGGLLAGQSEIFGVTGWRWVFLVNTPTGIAALFVVSKVLKLPHERKERTIDWWGAAILPLVVIPILTVAEQGRDWGWGSPRSIACYALGAVALVVFIMVERAMQFQAIVPLAMFKIQTFRMTMVCATLVGAGMFGGIMLIPQYLQIVRGLSATKAGLMTTPLMVGLMIASVVSGGGIAKTGRYKIFTLAGTLLTGGGLLLFHTIGVDTPLWQPMAYMVLYGIGLGMCTQTLTAAAQNSVPPRARGLGTALVTFFRQVGGSLGIAALMAVLFSTVGGKITDALKAAQNNPAFVKALHDPAVQKDPHNAKFFQMVKGGKVDVSDTSWLNSLDSRLARPFKEGFANSIDETFLVASIILVVGFLAVLMAKEIPIQSPAALAAKAAEAAAQQQAAAGAGAPAGAPQPVGVGAPAAPGYSGSETMQLRIRRRSLESPTLTLHIVAAPEETNAAIPLPWLRNKRQEEEVLEYVPAGTPEQYDDEPLDPRTEMEGLDPRDMWAHAQQIAAAQQSRRRRAASRR
jgi:EmrB/QacA subfamily drug resistance transporter